MIPTRHLLTLILVAAHTPAQWAQSASPRPKEVADGSHRTGADDVSDLRRQLADAQASLSTQSTELAAARVLAEKNRLELAALRADLGTALAERDRATQAAQTGAAPGAEALGQVQKVADERTARIASLEAELQIARRNHEQAKSALIAATRETSSLREQVSALKRELDTNAIALTDARAELNRAAATNVSVRERDRLARENAAATESIARLSTQLEQATAATKAMEAELSGLRERAAAAEQANGQVAQLRSLAERETAARIAAEERLRLMAPAASQANAANAESTAAIQELQRRIHELDTQLQAQRKRAESVEAAHGRVSTELSQAQEQLVANVKARQAAEAELATLTSRATSAAELTASVDQLREQLRRETTARQLAEEKLTALAHTAPETQTEPKDPKPEAPVDTPVVAKSAPAIAVAAPASREVAVPPTTNVVEPKATAPTVRPLSRPTRPGQVVAPVAAITVPRPSRREHVVAAGDTLSHIAVQYYGAAGRWPEILEANRDLVRDERRLYVGRRLLIP